MNGSGVAISPAHLQPRCNQAQFSILSETHHFHGSKAKIFSKCHSLVNRNSSGKSIGRFLHRPSFSVSASSLSGSAATIPGGEATSQVEEKKKRRKKKQIAGIDQDELLDPEQLADPDSCFCEFRGVKIHHKLYESSEAEEHGTVQKIASDSNKKLEYPIILLHGFGASVFSWSKAMKRLAEATSTPKVVAFDRPAFGLTSTLDPSSINAEDSKSLNPYSMAFAVLATLYFIDFFKTEKSVLVGHSAGSIVAVETYFEAPDRVAAMILVAPAIFAPNPTQKAASKNKLAEGAERENGDFLGMLGNSFMALLKILSRLAASIARTTLKLLNGMMNMLNSLYKKALSAILCSALGVMLIRMAINQFGVVAVKNAWYDPSQVSEEVVNGYTKPLRVKGWDKALAEFTAATIAAVESEPRPPISSRLHDISCPVLIVTGDTDRIVPAWNAKRLSQAIPGSSLEVIKNCGHLPHEEKVEEFVSVVQKFLQTAFSHVKEPSVLVQPS